MTVQQTNLLEFIGVEETNLLVTSVKCHAEIAQAFPMLDGAFQAPLQYVDVNVKDKHKTTVISLYLYTHFHLYFSTVCLLRCHLSDSLGSTRKAIDATLTAYRLIEEPATVEQYEQRHKNYQNIKGYIARARNADNTKFPLAEELIPLHELCSEFGSHADISSFIHRVSIEGKEGEDKGLFKIQMFQTPDSDLELRAYFVQTLLAYAIMAKIFSAYLVGLAAGLDAAAWNSQLGDLEKQFAQAAHKFAEQHNVKNKTAAAAAQ